MVCGQSVDKHRSVKVEKRQSTALTSADASKLLSTMAFTALGQNAAGNNGAVWLGDDGAYTNEVTNDSGEDLIFIQWGPMGSWVNAVAPLITVSLAPGESTTISMANGQSGAFSAIYSDTQMLDGQVSNTWGEYTTTPEGVVDVSREPNMSGHNMTIVGPQCTTDMDTCVFLCSSGNVCMDGYILQDCAPGSQPGAQYGTFGGSPSGGCGWNGASSAALQTYLA